MLAHFLAFNRLNPRNESMLLFRQSVVFVLLFLGSLAHPLALIAQETPKSDGKLVEPSQETKAGQAEVKRAENLPDDINRGFLDPNMKPEEYIKRFEIESREVFAQRRAIVESMELKEGLAVADIGAGTGLFLKPLSIAVGGSGKLFAVEISPSFVKHLRGRVAEEKLENSQVVFCSDRDANLARNSVDRLLICDVYHHFEFPEATLATLHAALKPGGMLILVDFYRDPDVSAERKQWLNGHIRAPVEVFRKEIESAGFQFKDQVNVEGFKENYLIRFVKPQ